MKKLAMLAGLAALALFMATDLAPRFPTGKAGHYRSSTPQTATVPPSDGGFACSAPGLAYCTEVLSPIPTVGWEAVTLYITNTGGIVIQNVLIEVSADKSTWKEMVDGACDNLAAAATCIVSYTGSYAWVRVEAQSSSDGGSFTSIHVSAQGS